MSLSTTKTGPARQAAAKATLADVTIVMEGRSPVMPVDSPHCPAAVLPAPGSQPSAVRGETTALTLPSPKARGESAFSPLTTQIANLFQSAVAFVGDGLALVDDAEYRRRLDVCRTCDRRTGKRCTACGCWIGLKARGRAFACPLDRWPP